MARAGAAARVKRRRSVVAATLSTEGVGSPIQRADQSDWSRRPMDQLAALLHADGSSAWSQTRTFQKAR